MKKISILMSVALTLGLFSSCEDSPAVPPMQENPQGPVLSASDVEILPEAILTDGQVLDLDKYVDNSIVTLFTVTKDELPEDFTLVPFAEISDTEDFSGGVKALPLIMDETSIKADFAEWHISHIELFGDDNVNESKAYYRIYADIINDATGADYRLGLTDTYLSTGSVMVKPMVSQMVIDTNVIKTPGSSNSWNADNSQYLYNVKDNDNPTQKYVGTALLSGEGFKFLNQNNEWIGGENGVLGSDKNIALSDGDGLYWIEVNFESNSYSLTKITTMGVIGAATNWGSDQELTANEDFSVWSGSCDVEGEWKIRMNGNWDMNYGGKLLNPSYNAGNFVSSGIKTVTINFSGHHPVIKLK